MRVPLTVGGFLDRAAGIYQERTAVIDEPGVPGSLGSITYGEMAARARGMARALEELGIEPGERVAIVSPNSGRFLTSFFGVSGFGRVLVPINFRLNGEEVDYIVRDSGARVLLYDPELAEELSMVEAQHRIALDGTADAGLFAPATPGDAPVWDGDEDATCSINYTSGTTARPKGVELTHRTCWLNAVNFGWHTTVSERDTFLHTLPMFHCNGWGMPYAVTAMGGCHIVQRRIDGESILSRIETHGVTLLCGAPAVVAAILKAGEVARSEGRPVPGAGTVRIVVAGAPPPTRLIERVEAELGWEFIQIYGLTETAPLLTINRAPKEWDDLDASTRATRLSRAGVAANGVELRVDEHGEVLARSNHVFAGYWNQRKESEQALDGGWFHSGDGGYLEGPYLVISDRKKDVIITGGENVSSIEVEDCLYRHVAVEEVAVIGVPDEKWGETVKALVVVAQDQTVTEAELIAHCRQHLAHFKAPTSVEFRPALVRTASGKLQKFKLRQPYWEGHDRPVL